MYQFRFRISKQIFFFFNKHRFRCFRRGREVKHILDKYATVLINKILYIHTCSEHITVISSCFTFKSFTAYFDTHRTHICTSTICKINTHNENMGVHTVDNCSTMYTQFIKFKGNQTDNRKKYLYIALFIVLLLL